MFWIVYYYLINSTMGSSQSQTNDNGEVDTSTGFHLIEIHTPSIGGTFVILAIVCITAYFIYRCFMRYRKKTIQQHTASGLPFYNPAPAFPAGWSSLVRNFRSKNSPYAPPALPEGV